MWILNSHYCKSSAAPKTKCKRSNRKLYIKEHKDIGQCDQMTIFTCLMRKNLNLRPFLL